MSQEANVILLNEKAKKTDIFLSEAIFVQLSEQ